MGKTTRSQSSLERQKWDKIFNGLVKMMKSQQEKLETLVKERKILEDRIKMQHENWVSDVRLFEDDISQMKSDAVAQEMGRMLEAAKYDMVLGWKNRDASLLKLKLEYTVDELTDFMAWFDLLRQIPKGGEPNSIGSSILEGETRRLQLEYNKLASEKKSEVSNLLAEKDFVWNQYKVMENDLTSKINIKHEEVDRANEKIEKLLASMEQLQSSNNEKDECIARLKSNIAEMEAGTKNWSGEISRLTQELELLRKSRSASTTPVLTRCTAGATTSNAGGSVQYGTNTAGIKGRLRNSGSSSVAQMSSLGGKNGNVVVRKEVPATRVPDHVDIEKGTRSSKRKAVDIVPILDTPKLFSSNFKVPKLKNSSPRLNVS